MNKEFYLEQARSKLDEITENPFESNPEQNNPSMNWVVGSLYATLLSVLDYLEKLEKEK